MTQSDLIELFRAWFRVTLSLNRFFQIIDFSHTLEAMHEPETLLLLDHGTTLAAAGTGSVFENPLYDSQAHKVGMDAGLGGSVGEEDSASPAHARAAPAPRSRTSVDDGYIFAHTDAEGMAYISSRRESAPPDAPSARHAGIALASVPGSDGRLPASNGSSGTCRFRSLCCTTAPRPYKHPRACFFGGL
jgi:hypothetical protein